jgi:diketogulonate reductase-like aldo/keto reductase
MQELVESGKVRSVGVSNFGLERLKEVFKVSTVPICNLQIEYHPLTKREVLPKFCQREDIVISAYSPLARGKVMKEPVLKEIGEKYGKTAVQVSLKWLVQREAVVIPKSSSREHLEADMDIFDWELSREDMDRINGIKNQKRLVDTKYT